MERQNRYFEEGFKRQKVRDLERNLVTIAELCREYRVSRPSVYKWIYKYSRSRKRQERQIVEKKSDTRKIKELQERIRELERMIGQKQILIDYQEKLIEIAEQKHQIEIKKKTGSILSGGSGHTGENTPGDSTKSTK